MRKSFVTLVISLAMAVMASAWAASCSGTPVTITFANWASAETATAKEVSSAISAFEAQNPCITVKPIAIPYNNVVSQLTIMAVGNNTPDVLELSSGMPQILAAQGALADLKKYANSDLLNDNYPKMLEDGTYQETLVALPLSLTPHGFWYNKDLMAKAGLDPNKPPQTIDELDKDMAVIKKKLPGVSPFGIMSDKALYTVVVMWPWLQAYCKNVPMSNQQLGWTQDCAVQAFQWFQSLAKKGYTPVGNDIKDNRQLFATNQMVFKLDGPYLRGIISSINSDYKSNDAFAKTFAVTKVPTGPTGTSQTAIDIHLISMGATTQHANAAWKFIKFMVSSPQDIKDFLIPEGGIPPLKSSDKQFKNLLDQPYQQAWINEIIPEAEPVPYNPAWSEASNHIISALQAVMNGDDVKQTLGVLETQLKRIYPNFKP